MFTPNVHPDWYEDSCLEFSLWRLDIGHYAQVQLNAKEVCGGYESWYIFIERDIRKEGNSDVRVSYACKSRLITDERSKVLLEASEQEVTQLLREELAEVMLLPDDERYLGTIDEQRAKLRNA